MVAAAVRDLTFQWRCQFPSDMIISDDGMTLHIPGSSCHGGFPMAAVLDEPLSSGCFRIRLRAQGNYFSFALARVHKDEAGVWSTGTDEDCPKTYATLGDQATSIYPANGVVTITLHLRGQAGGSIIVETSEGQPGKEYWRDTSEDEDGDGDTFIPSDGVACQGTKNLPGDLPANTAWLPVCHLGHGGK
jgi:hypothetical protein